MIGRPTTWLYSIPIVRKRALEALTGVKAGVGQGIWCNARRKQSSQLKKLFKEGNTDCGKIISTSISSLQHQANINQSYCDLPTLIQIDSNTKLQRKMTAQTPVWFITAASSGFGKYMALEALSRGHKVIATARSESRIADLKSAGADTIALDVTWPLPEIEKVAAKANAKYGYITHLVNAAGYILVGAVEETS